MRDKCFDEGIIQAFFDGELESGLLEQVARHVSDCEPCAFLMSEIEAESACVAAAFEIEDFELVPSERLRTKIFAEIAGLENGGSWLQKAAAAFGFSKGFGWTNPSLMAFASLVLVVGVVAVLLTSKPDIQNQPVASSGGPKAPTVDTRGQTSPGAVDTAPEPVIASSSPKIRQVSAAEVKQSDFKAVKLGGFTPAAAAEPQPLQGEERYLQTIKTLKSSVDDRKDTMLKPSAQVAYERDMAVVDDAINKMQKAARKNPKDEAARQVLFASYQNKIDLLSSVSDKTELMASMR
jgi:hypothetical protein